MLLSRRHFAHPFSSPVWQRQEMLYWESTLWWWLSCPYRQAHTHTHPHTEGNRERERERHFHTLFKSRKDKYQATIGTVFEWRNPLLTGSGGELFPHWITERHPASAHLAILETKADPWDFRVLSRKANRIWHWMTKNKASDSQPS